MGIMTGDRSWEVSERLDEVGFRISAGLLCLLMRGYRALHFLMAFQE